MLIEFRVGNYRSFREEQTLSLVASKDTELDKNCIDQGKLRLLRAAGIYGPNASGKSNLIKALFTMQQIIEEPAKPGEKLPVTPFKLDEKYSKEPSSFEVTFFHGKVRYQYGFTATTERICDEWLYAYPKGRSRDIAQTWFERKFNKKTNKTDWNFGSYLKGEREKLKDRTINNILFLSAGAQWNNKQLTNVYEWFSEKLRIILPSERTPIITIDMLKSTEEEKKWKKLSHAYINNMMQRADFGIHGINIREEEIDLKEFEFQKEFEFPPDTPEEIRNKILKNLATRIEFIHRTEPTGKDIHFSPLEESDGTRRFFELAGPWLLAILEGMTLLVDELEASLHPFLVRELIEVIQSLDINKGGAQLVFATHDTTLLDPELFRRDQIWFTEKNGEGATQLYSMSDYKERKPRKGEAMQKGYLAGRYGAIPIIKAFELDG
ncbi:MAG: ATP-binding protein [Planctomycetes bacterium]|nr:ATP-binding protein [Planctomycetota bacterium]MBL7146718.1 ATP-binding protein [Phycisphaerae bacterium]